MSLENPSILFHNSTDIENDNSQCCDICEYEELSEKYSWDNIYDIIEQALDNSSVENIVKLLKLIENVCCLPILSNTITHEMLDDINVYKWFIDDYFKDGGYYIKDHINNKEIHVPRRRIRYWNDEITDYEALSQTIYNTLVTIDTWAVEYYYNDNTCTDMVYDNAITSIVNIYNILINMCNTDEDEECDSIS